MPSDRRYRAELLSVAQGVWRPQDGPGASHEGTGAGERSAEASGGRSVAGQGDPDGGGTGKLLSPVRRRRCIDHIRGTMSVSERRVCRVLGQHRSTQRKVPRGADDEAALTGDIIALARQYGRYGYRRVTAIARQST
ncbi:putative transposase [Acidiphilium multivorum AIU301]|uniref:Putative transposase n=1 Tax=Acidiphilium multivorum (strain DSM 11245 / JCM 8867 / NBRC 100883 / AIU 301) TaxID=926570 RepID=F0IZW5_ACIMA|nr:putative transposase [Acidiphilium multivorum AIU301]